MVVDPEGMEIRWSTLREILETGKADVIYNYMCTAIRRQFSKACKKDRHAYHEFFGSGEWKSLCGLKEEVKIGEALHEVFKSSIEALGYDVCTASVFAKYLKWHYHLDVVVRRRKRRGDKCQDTYPWLRGFEEYAEFVEKIGEDGLRKVLFTASLDRFF